MATLKPTPKVTSTIKKAAPVVRPAAVKPASTIAPRVAPKPITSTIKPAMTKPVVTTRTTAPVATKAPVIKTTAPKPTTPLVKPTVTTKPVTSTLKPVTSTVKPATAPKVTTKTPVAPPKTPTPLPGAKTTPTVTTKTPTVTPKVTTPTTLNPTKSTSNAAKNTVLGSALAMGANSLMNKLGSNVANKITGTNVVNRPTVTAPRPVTTTPTRSVVNAPKAVDTSTAGQTTEITNSSQPGEDAYGWRYFSDGTAISPTGEYYQNGQLVWSPSGATDTTTADTSTATTRSLSGGADTTTADNVNTGGDYSQYYTDASGNIYDANGNLVASADSYNTDQTGADTTVADNTLTDQYYTDANGNVYDSSGNLYYDASGDTYNQDNTDYAVADNTDYSNIDNTDTSSSDVVESANGGFIDLLYKQGGGVRNMADGGPIDNGDGTYTYDNGDGSYTTVDDQGNELYVSDSSGYYTPQDYYGLTSDTSGDTSTSTGFDGGQMDVNAGRTQMDDGTFMEDDGSGTMYYYDANGNWLYSTDYNNQPTAFSSADGNTVYYDDQGQPFTYDNSGQVQYYNQQTGGFGGQQPGGQPRTLTPNIQQQPVNQQNQNNMLNTLKDFASNNAGAGVIGALIGNLMSQGSTSTGGVNEGVDMSQLAAMQNAGGSGISLGGARDTGAGAYVPYEQYAYWNPQNQERLYSDLGVSGYNQPQQAEEQYFQDDQGNYFDSQGNPVDAGMFQQEQTEAPQFADGGSTYFTYGKPITPADNLNGMKKGGLSAAHTVHSHHTNPIVEGRIDFRNGSAVNGAGDGQSDDIPAMLADGEYVIDADTVAQLGNGSNKAGAKLLDGFREQIRAHKRSAPINKIPPKSKSPLAYLKEAMNG